MRSTLSSAVAVVAAVLAAVAVWPPPGEAGSPESRWNSSNESSRTVVDHSEWWEFLNRFVEPGADGVNRVRYGAVGAEDLRALDRYVGALESIDVSALRRDEQLAYWLNLYNVVTVRLVVRNWPVGSIRDIDISPGWFSDGPWKRRLVTVEGEALSLDDIEHTVLRPIWGDPRIHYAVNCASIGCPNLMRRPYLGARVDRQLDEAARAYVNHPRGVRFDRGRLVVSKIYRWFEDDFGGSEADVLAHIRRYAESELRHALTGRRKIDTYRYDWSINAVERLDDPRR